MKRGELIVGAICVFIWFMLFAVLLVAVELPPLTKFRPLIESGTNLATILVWVPTLLSLYYLVRAVLAAMGHGTIIRRLALRATIPGYSIYAAMPAMCGFTIALLTGEIGLGFGLIGLSTLGVIACLALEIQREP